jgi:hypothetical protein
LNREEFAKSFAKDVQKRLLLEINRSSTKRLKWTYDSNKNERIIVMIKGETFLFEKEGDNNAKA